VAAPRFLGVAIRDILPSLIFAGASFSPIALYKALNLRDLVILLMLPFRRCGWDSGEVPASVAAWRLIATLHEAVLRQAVILYLDILVLVAAVLGILRFGAVYLMWFFSFF